MGSPPSGIFDRVQRLRDEIAGTFHNLNHNPNLTQYDYDYEYDYDYDALFGNLLTPAHFKE